MANSLRDWLKPEISQAFKDGIAWRKSRLATDRRVKIKSETTPIKQDPEAGVDDEDEDEQFTYDGSNLRVDLMGSVKGNRLQIHSIQQSGKRYFCELSDGHHIVRGQVQALASTLEQDTGCPFTQLQGGILSIRSFKLALTPFGNADSQILLEVRDAKYVKGSAGTGYFGHPRPLWQDSSLRSLFGELANLDNPGLDEDDEPPDQPGESVEPPPAEIIEVPDDDGDDDDLQSQHGGSVGSLAEIPPPSGQFNTQRESFGFATQVPVDTNPRRIRQRSPPGDLVINGAANLARPLPPKRASGPNTRDQLLARLKSTKPKNNEFPVASGLAVTVDLDPPDEVVIIDQGPSNPAADTRPPPITETLDPATGALSETRLVSQGEAIGAASSPTEKHASATLAAETSSDAGALTASANVKLDGRVQGAIKEANYTRVSLSVATAAAPIVRDASTRSYLPRRPDALYLKYAARRIPRNQRDLLQKTQSWYPPEPGFVFPEPNVPVDVLKALTVELDKRVAGKSNTSHESLAENTVVSDLPTMPPPSNIADVSVADDSEKEMSWSSSPARSQHAQSKFMKNHVKPLNARAGDLPPDSSAPEADVETTPNRPSPQRIVLSPSPEDESLDDDDLDLPTSLPRPLGSEVHTAPIQSATVRLPPPVSHVSSSAPVTVAPRSSTVEVKESPLKSSSDVITQSTGEAVRATQPLPAPGPSSKASRANVGSPDVQSKLASIEQNDGSQRITVRLPSTTSSSNQSRSQNSSARRSPPMGMTSHGEQYQSTASRQGDNHLQSRQHRADYAEPPNPRDHQGLQPLSAANSSKKRQVTFDREEPVEPVSVPKVFRDRSPPRKKQRSNIVWGSQDFAEEDPALKQQQLRREFRRQAHGGRGQGNLDVATTELGRPHHGNAAITGAQSQTIDTREREGRRPSTASSVHSVTSPNSVPTQRGTPQWSPPTRPAAMDRGQSQYSDFVSPAGSAAYRRPNDATSRDSYSGSNTNEVPRYERAMYAPSSSSGVKRKADTWYPNYDQTKGPHHESQSKLDTEDTGTGRIDDADRTSFDTGVAKPDNTASDKDHDEYDLFFEDDDLESDGIDEEDSVLDLVMGHMDEDKVGEGPPKHLPLRFGDNIFGDFARHYHETPTVQQAQEEVSPAGKIDVLSWKVGG